MAEEDLIFGKNRHLFGGIEPSNMKKFSVIGTLGGKPSITAVLPDDTVINGQTLCTVAGAVIRREDGAYPQNEFDGVWVADISASMTFTDETAVEDEAYYYAAFPYTTQGVYNRSPANRARDEAHARGYYFGYDMDTANPNPALRVTYPVGVDNAGYAPAHMNFGGLFDYGGWPSLPGEKFMPRPCMLNFDGTVNSYLDPDDYEKKVNGNVSRVADMGFTGNAMMEWPKIYVKRWEEDDVYHFRVSDAKLDDDFECWSNYDHQNNEIDHFYTPVFFGSKDSSGRLRSISGAANSVSATTDDNFTSAEANGVYWHIEVAADRMLINDLLTMMAKSTDLKTAFGAGRTLGDNRGAAIPGIMNTRGLFWGADDGTDGVKVFGMEHYWGNLWRCTAGLINNQGTLCIKATRGTKDGSSSSDYNTSSSGYIILNDAPVSGKTGGYISKCKTTPFGRFPYEASGSATTFECDGMYFMNNQKSIALFGGMYNNDLLAGPFCVRLSSTSASSSLDIGAALSCKPLAVQERSGDPVSSKKTD